MKTDEVQSFRKEIIMKIMFAIVSNVPPRIW